MSGWARTTTPSADATTGVPRGATTSTPPWGLRGLPLRMRWLPKTPETRPRTGHWKREAKSARLESLRRTAAMAAPSRRMRSRSLGAGVTFRDGRPSMRCTW